MEGVEQMIKEKGSNKEVVWSVIYYNVQNSHFSQLQNNNYVPCSASYGLAVNSQYACQCILVRVWTFSRV